MEPWGKENQPFLSSRHANGRDVEPFFNGLPHRYAVISYERAKDSEAAFVDQVPVSVDHGFDRSLRQTLDLPDNELDRAIEDTLLAPLAEDELEGVGEVVTPIRRKSRWELEVVDATQLDRLGMGLVGHRGQCARCFRLC
jgi:hypothetical protein